MKVIVISTVRKLQTGDLEDYCDYLDSIDVPLKVVDSLRHTGKATWITEDENGEVQTKYEVHEIPDA